jgi:hypothetical protein
MAGDTGLGIITSWVFFSFFFCLHMGPSGTFPRLPKAFRWPRHPNLLQLWSLDLADAWLWPSFGPVCNHVGLAHDVEWIDDPRSGRAGRFLPPTRLIYDVFGSSKPF